MSARYCAVLLLGFATMSDAAYAQMPPDDAAPTEAAPVAPRARHATSRRKAAAPDENSSGISGRYAIMRDKRDTGCMLTLDSARVRGGERAQLAPGCRDQGIVVFDPSTWQIIKGEIVLTARAGHKARLQKAGEGTWRKDPKDGGKPLGLKRL